MVASKTSPTDHPVFCNISTTKKKSKSLINAHAFGFHVKRKDNLNQYIRGILVIYSVSDVWTSNKHWG